MADQLLGCRAITGWFHVGGRLFFFIYPQGRRRVVNREMAYPSFKWSDMGRSQGRVAPE